MDDRRVVADDLLVHGDPVLAAAIIAADAAIRTPDGIRSGPAGFTAFVDSLNAAAPDARWDIRAVSPDGERVRLDARLVGTFRQPFLGQAITTDAIEVPATIDVWFANGMVHEVRIAIASQ